jgi:hypothetical protein
MIEIRAAQRRLAMLWFSGAAIAFVWLLLQTWAGLYSGGDADAAKKAWSWFGSTVVPTLSLMLGVLVQQAATPKQARVSRVPALVFNICLGLSALYLLVLCVVIFAARSYEDRVSFLTGSMLYLGLLQGLVGTALGAFFAAPGD